MHVLDGSPDLPDDPPYILFEHGAIFFEKGREILMHGGLVQPIQKMIIAKNMVEFDDVGMVEVALQFDFLDELSDVVGGEQLFLEHFQAEC